MNDNIVSIHAVIAQKLRVTPDYLQQEFTLDEFGLDSLASAEVVLGVEKAFGIRIDFEAISASFSRDTKLSEFIAMIARIVEQSQCKG